MKTGLKALALAATLAVASTGANAAITSGAFGADGELFLTLWDTTTGNEASFNLGLNLTVGTFDANGSYSFNVFADPVFSTYFDAGNLSTMSNWKWNITGSKDLGDESMVRTTSVTTNLNWTNGITDNAATYARNYVDVLNCTGSCNATGTNNINALQYAANADSGYGSNFQGGAPINNAAGVDQSLSFLYFANTTSYESQDPAIKVVAPYVWTLGSDGLLTYNVASSPVPVPAAVWLFGSGLMGMLGLSRRRSLKVA